MIIHKKWKAGRATKNPLAPYSEWLREGWFLFGFIPLYVRDVVSRGEP